MDQAIQLGEKIRRLRLEKGFSQQQVAGPEFTRAYISAVELGKVRPTPESLAILARRLDRPLSYFLGEEEPQEDAALLGVLLRTAARDLEQGQGADAVEAARQAMRVARRLPPAEQVRAQAVLVRALQYVGAYEEALAEGEELLAGCLRLGENGALAEAYALQGESALQLHEIERAKRLFERGLPLCADHKRLAHLRVQMLVGLGACHFQLGEIELAMQTTREGLTAAGLPIAGSDTLACAWLRMALYLQAQGEPDGAMKCCRRAHAVLQRVTAQDPMRGLRIMAGIELEQGAWETAHALFTQSLEYYERTGKRRLKAAALEGLSRYHLSKGNWDQAEAHCREAVVLLDQEDHPLVRGRVYRLLGEVHAARGEAGRATDMLQVSLALFRRIKATGEANATRPLLERLAAGQPPQ